MNEIIIEARIKDDNDFAIMCLMKLYEKQEADEQAVQQSTHLNGMGFNKVDSLVLSPIAEKVHAGKKLTQTEFAILQKVLPKYAKQLSLLLTQKQIEE